MVDFVTRYRGREVATPSKQIQKAADKLSPRTRKKIGGLAAREMRRYLASVAATLAERHGVPWQRGQGRQVNLTKRSGRGIGSLKNILITQRGESVTGNIRLNKYMAVHEHGAIIKAKRAKYLTIPLDAALNDNGTPKKRSAREWQNTLVSRSKRGNLIIFQKRGRRVVPLYVLKEKVRIPARLGLRKELSKQRTAFRRSLIARIKELT